MLERRVVYEIPGMQEVTKRNVVYDFDKEIPLTMDVYYPPNLPANSSLPAVIFILGFPGSVVQERFGVKLKDSGQYVSWGQLAAASGLIAITYETTQPEKDIYSILGYVRNNSKTLQIDADRLGIWACSGNVPTALSLLVDASLNIRCAVLYYGAMFDQSGFHEMEELANRSGFAYPCKTHSVANLSKAIPLFVVRTGDDDPQLNKSIEYFICEATRRNLRLTFVNYADGQHAFDLQNNTAMSQQIIKYTLAFLQDHLFPPM